MNEANTRFGKPAPLQHRERVRHMIAELGEAKAAAELKIGRPTLARVVAALPLKAGTLALLREGLGEAGQNDRREVARV